MTVLPSSIFAPTTTTVGIFEAAPSKIAGWVVDGLKAGGASWHAYSSAGTVGELIAQLQPLTIPSIERYLLVGVDRVTFLLNNSALGTDLGMLPSLCARELGITAIRATLVEEDAREYPATILEVFTGDSNDSLRCRRMISAANDGGQWRFDQFGEPFEFENPGSYQSGTIKERFTGPMLYHHLDCLGIPELPGLDCRPTEAMLLSA